MKSTAIIINTARGPIMDNAALAELLKAEKIAGAGIDVYETEPPLPENNPLKGSRRLKGTMARSRFEGF